MIEDTDHAWDDRASWVPPPSEEYQKAHGWRDGQPPPGSNGDARGQPQPPETYQLLSDLDLEALPDPVWLIDRVLVQNSLVALYGPWASFKSFIALDWAYSLATGLPWLGRTVMRCDVLYICAEGVGGLKNRIAAWKQHHGITESIPGVRVIPMAVNIMDLTEAKRLILSVLAEQAASGFTPGVIIADTLARSMVGGDENSVRDMSIMINHADLIRRELGGITFLPVHHAGKDADRGMRGSTGLPGAVDTTFRVTRKDNSMTVELFCEKQKDGEDGWSVHLEAEKVTLPPRPGTMSPRQSLVLVLGETPHSSAGRPGPRKGDAALGLRVLADTVVTQGFQLPVTDGFPSSTTRGTNELAFRREFYRRLTDREQDAKKHAFNRMVKSLRDAGLIGLCDSKVWLVKPHDRPQA
jgi:hypothetical protein